MSCQLLLVGFTALHNAGLYGHTEIAQALLAAGADIEAETNASGETALDFARQYKRTETIKLLEEAAKMTPQQRKDKGKFLTEAETKKADEEAKKVRALPTPSPPSNPNVMLCLMKAEEEKKKAAAEEGELEKAKQAAELQAASGGGGWQVSQGQLDALKAVELDVETLANINDEELEELFTAMDVSDPSQEIKELLASALVHSNGADHRRHALSQPGRPCAAVAHERTRGGPRCPAATDATDWFLWTGSSCPRY
eukprot:g69875.t1